MACYILILTTVALAHVTSAYPVNAVADDGGRSDLAQSNAANRDPGFRQRMGTFIGWSVLALFIVTGIGLATWAIIRARRHKKEKYGTKETEPIQMANRQAVTGTNGAAENV